MASDSIVRHRAAVAAYMLAIASFVTLAVLVARHFATYGEATAWVHHTQQVLTTIQGALGALREVETGQRGYLLTGNELFLESHEHDATMTRARFEELEELTEDNPVQQARLARLRPVVEQKIAFVDHTLALFRAGDGERARALVSEGRGKALMDQIRRELSAMEEQERQLLAARARRADQVAWRTTMLMFLGDAIAFAALAAGTVLTGRELHRRRRRDQEERLRIAQDALDAHAERADARIVAALGEMPFAVSLLDPEGAPLLESPSMRELRRDRAGAEPPGAVELLQPDGTPFPAGLDPLVRATRDGAGTRSARAQLVRADGSRVDVLVDAAPARARGGRSAGAAIVIRDVADLRRIEDERLWYARFRDVFVSALGHELRNPLSVITAGTASLARRARNETDAKVVARMHASAERMARMIDQLLEMTRTRLGGGMAIERAHTDLGAVTRRVVEQLEVALPERAIELTTEGELAGAWDDGRIARAIEEIVRNAIGHGREDTPVRVAVVGRGDHVEIGVHNVGNPVDEERLALMFDPFRRAAERKRTKSAGLGIGLYLAREIVIAHGGRIEVRSSAEAGTLVRILLPRT